MVEGAVAAIRTCAAYGSATHARGTHCFAILHCGEKETLTAVHADLLAQAVAY